MGNQSSADLYIEAMLRLRDLDSLTENDQPMRHQVRSIKAAAMNAIEAACRQAIQLAYTAQDLARESNTVTAEAVKAALIKEPS